MATTHVNYNSKRLIPAPFVSINKSYQTTNDGTKVGSVFQIQVIGTIVAHKGSPDSNGTFWTAGGFPSDETPTADQHLRNVIRKQEAIRELFSQDGYVFEVQSADGSQPLKCNPRVVSVEFPNDLWYNRSQYTITLEADVVYVNGQSIGEDEFSEYISSADENWSIETNDEVEGTEQSRTFRLTHSLSAVGKRFFNEDASLQKAAWQQARDWVQPRLGFDSVIALSSGVNNLPDYYKGLNHTRSETVDEIGGSYSVTESWVLASGYAVEEFTVEKTVALEDGITRVTVNGNIRGFEVRDSELNLTQSKYTSASDKFSAIEGQLFSRAQTYAGTTLNTQVLNTTVGKNPVTGTINYSYQYDDRPSRLFTGSRSEAISMGDSFGVNAFASVFVLGRSAGPVLQDLGTKQPTTRDLNVEIVFGASYVGTGSITSRLVTNHPRNVSTTHNELLALVAAAHPVTAGALNNNGVAATTAYVSNQNENWDIVTGRYTYSVQWTYE